MLWFLSYTAESLPKKPLARMDYVLITVDMTQLHSLTILRTLAQHMKDRFLTNKMAVVVTKSKCYFYLIESTQIVSEKKIQRIFSRLQKHLERKFKMTCIA